MRRLALALALLGLLSLTGAGVALAEAFTVTTVEELPISFVTPGCGEPILLSGTLHLVTHVTLDADGGIHLVSEANPQGVTGLGLASGTIYQGTGVGLSSFNSGGPLPLELTAVNSFKIIGRGPTDNLLVQGTFHVTVNAHGEVTSVVDHFRVRCQG